MCERFAGSPVPRPSPQTERLRWLLEFLAKRPREPQTLAQIARHLGVAKATCMPMLAALTRAGWLVRDPVRRTYRLGPALSELGRAAETASIAGREVEELTRLSATAGARCIVWETSDDDLVLSEIVGSRGPEHTWAGLTRGHRFRPLAPLGASLVAWTDEERVRSWTAGGAELDAARCRPALEASRRRGYVVELMDEMQFDLFQLVEHLRAAGPLTANDLLTSINRHAARELLERDYLVGEIDPAATYRPVSVNAPVFDRWREPQLVVCLVGGTTDVAGRELCRMGELVRDCAADLTRAAGGVFPPSWPG